MKISINNGGTFATAQEITEFDIVKYRDDLIEAMDEEIAERVADELTPCTPREFLARYLELAESDLIIG